MSEKDEARKRNIAFNDCSDKTNCDFYFPGLVCKDEFVSVVFSCFCLAVVKLHRIKFATFDAVVILFFTIVSNAIIPVIIVIAFTKVDIYLVILNSS